MNTRHALVAIALAACAGVAPAHAQAALVEPAPAPAAAPAAATPAPAVDYRRMRDDAAARPGFSGYAFSLAEKLAVDEFGKKWQENPLEALGDFKQFVGSNPHSIVANRIVAEAFETIAAKETNPELVALAREVGPRYRAAYEGLVQSVLASGDGSTCETGWHVLSITEEYEVLGYLQLEEPDQFLVQQSDRVCDGFNTRAADGGERRVFFDIGTFFGGK